MAQNVLCFLFVLLLLIFLLLLYFSAFICPEDQIADASEDEGEHQCHRHCDQYPHLHLVILVPNLLGR